MESVLAALTIILLTARLAGLASRRLGLAPVVGEILGGIVLGNLPGSLVPRAALDSGFMRELSELGICLLLFSVALESSLGAVARVGSRAMAVAVVGVVAPFLLTLLAFRSGLVDSGSLDAHGALVVAIFAGATLTATSVGITARLLKGAGQLGSRTGQIILNAAVFDDVLGLLVLAGVTSYVASGAVSLVELARLGLRVLAFFAIVLPLGYVSFPWLLRRQRSRESLTAFGLAACFGLAWLASRAGLAPIVGAFFAGLLVDERGGSERLIADQIEPIVHFLAPVFFVLIGASIQLGALTGAGPGALAAVGVLFGVAALGKLACGLVAGPGADGVSVGLGMIPRGEVGLIFAVTGRELQVVSERLFAVLVLVVLATTVLPPVVLERRLARTARRKRAS